ncbi:hypothetical protein [Neorhizobium galegae]|uniref:hypothetical protein n=1 Tax=Neorhizobium galegae TaxID=399 RepID=UPI0021045D81|nr:hypothetical protein [Neorhizobium galegae]MCQ1855466.1 hypothetical protein [Neorhizobium galegae]
MSRNTTTVTKIASRHADPDATIGYDRPLQTFFLQAFATSDGEDLELWLGTEFQEFETLAALRAAAVRQGFDFVPLASGILHRLLDDHSREAIRPVSETILQDLLNNAAPC